MKKPKLVYVLHDIQVGGVEVALVSAIPELVRQFDLKVVVLGKIDPKMCGHLSEQERSCLHAFNYPLIIYPVFIFRIALFIINQRPDVLVCSLWRASLAGAIVKRLNPGIKFIPFIHSTTFFHKLDKIISSKAIRQADHIFADSSATAHFVRNIAGRSSEISVISFFIKPSPPRKTAAPFDNQCAKFMFLGRLSKVKNLPMTLEVIRFLRASGINATLDLYGPDAGELECMLRYIARHDLQSVVICRGEINADQKAVAFGEHHFLIQLSSHEGMAMSVAEAMQNGLVCFTTPVGEIRNYAKDMHTALFANIDDQDEWEMSLLKIRKLIRDPVAYERISENCFQQFQHVETYAHSLSKAILTHTINHENTAYHHIS